MNKRLGNPLAIRLVPLIIPKELIEQFDPNRLLHGVLAANYTFYCRLDYHKIPYGQLKPVAPIGQLWSAFNLTNFSINLLLDLMHNLTK